MTTFGERLRSMRTEAGITQKELSELVGCVPQAISQYERGEYVPRNEEIRKSLCDVLGVTETWLFSGTGEKTVKEREAVIAENIAREKAKTQVVFYAKDARHLKAVEMVISHLRDMDVSLDEKKTIHKALSEIRGELECRVIFGVGEIK